jgi:hypothetical protein
MPEPAEQDRARGRGGRAKKSASKRAPEGERPEGKAAAAKSPTPSAPAAPAARTPPAAAPIDAEAVLARLTSFKGVGRRSAEALVEAFGPAKVFDGLARDPERVKQVLGVRRGEALLEAYRSEQGPAPSGGAPAAPRQARGAQPSDEAAGEAKSKRPRGRRGGRRGKRSGSASGKE